MRRGIVVTSLVLVALAALPQVAMGAKPYREPFRSPVGAGSPMDRVGSFSFVAREGETACPFAILVEVEVFGVSWEFTDGRFAGVNVANIWMTNLETGTSYLQRSDYRITATLLPDGKELVAIDGKRWMGFAVGDDGPEGTVVRGGADYFVTGTQTFIYDPKKNVVSSYQLSGQAVDACEVLA